MTIRSTGPLAVPAIAPAISGVEDAVCAALLILGMDDMTSVSTDTLNVAIDGGEVTGILWQDVEFACLVPTRGTLAQHRTCVEIDAVLRVTGEDALVEEHAVVARASIDDDGVRLDRLMQRSAAMDAQ